MHYVYLIYSTRLSEFYIGQTSDLKKRFESHNQANNIATKDGVPWRLVYYEAFPTKGDAIRRERRLKHHGKGLSELKRRITLVDDEKVRT